MKYNRESLIREFKKQYDKNILKENGKWYWVHDNNKSLISNSWLSMMLTNKNKTNKENPPLEIQQYKDKVMAENVGLDTSAKEQKPENETTTLSEEKLKEIKNAKRREKRLQRKLEKKKDEQKQ
jgi:hypothetical protein